MRQLISPSYVGQCKSNLYFSSGIFLSIWILCGCLKEEHFHPHFSAEVCDEIEEHFRRSLGENYPAEKSPENGNPSRSPIEVMPPTPPGSASLPKGSAPVSITGTVDDHFAKALGDKWSRIKTEMEPATNNNPASPPNTPSPAALTSQVFKHTSFVSSWIYSGCFCWKLNLMWGGRENIEWSCCLLYVQRWFVQYFGVHCFCQGICSDCWNASMCRLVAVCFKMKLQSIFFCSLKENR